MFRVWGKIFKDNHMLADTTICDGGDDSRTHKVFHALDEICYQFDLSKPIWLESNIREFSIRCGEYPDRNCGCETVR